MELTLNKYQEEAASTAIYKGEGTLLGLLYTGLGLGEAGEVQNKLKKLLRDDELDINSANSEISLNKRRAIRDELGGNLWYIAMCAKELGYSLEEVALSNLLELSLRKSTNVLKGEGDDRGKIKQEAIS